MFLRHSSSIPSRVFDESINLRLRTLLFTNLLMHDYFEETDLVCKSYLSAFHILYTFRDLYDKVNANNHWLTYSNYRCQRIVRNNDNEEDEESEQFQHLFENQIDRYNHLSPEDEIFNSKHRQTQKTQSSKNFISSSFKQSDYNLSNSNSSENYFFCFLIDSYRTCEVMMVYKNDLLSTHENDQIVVKQKESNDGQTIIIYKGCVKRNNKFSFKSQRFLECPFELKFYINGRLNFHLFSCCEYKYSQGKFKLGQSFIIQHISKSIPCEKCQQYRTKTNRKPSFNRYPRKIDSSNFQCITKKERITLKEGKSIENRNKQEQNDDNNNQSIFLTDDDENNQENRKEKIKTISLLSKVNNEDLSSELHNNLQMHRMKTSRNEDEIQCDLEQKLRESRNNNNDNSKDNSLQTYLSILQTDVHRIELHEQLAPRYQGNVENFVVIIVGIENESASYRSVVNFIKMIDNIEAVKPFMNTFLYERFILIIDNRLVEFIDDLSQFNSIYLISNEKQIRNNYLNIRGNFPNIKSIFNKIKEECVVENEFFSTKFFLNNETFNQSFCYSQLLKETLLKKDNESNLKKDFIHFCRYHYNGNNIELNFIEEIEQNFKLDQSIWWYTRYCFIRKMLNRALRTEEIDILYKMRWFIQALDYKIKDNSFSEIVYRIHYYTYDQFKILKENYTNCLLSFGTFLDCKLNRPSFIENIQGMETILFRIKTKNGIKIQHLRFFESKIEVLLPFDNVYRIESIEEYNNYNNHWWNVDITSINKNDELLKDLTNNIRQEIEGPVVLIQLGKLLLLNNGYYQVDYLANLLFNDGSIENNPTLLASLAALHHLLGSVDNQRCNYRAARIQFEKSLKIFLSFIPEFNQILSATYNNIGSMFYQEDQHEQAIIYHQKALQCQLRSSSPDMEAIATYSGNIGAVYLDQEKYDQALLHYKRTLLILQQSISNEESQPLAMIYDRIASIYWKMEKPNEALSFYQKALQLELKYLPENDHKISVSYFNLSTACAKLNQLDDAINYAEKSIKQLLKSVSSDHPEVKENMDQLENLRRRKWLYKLYE